ncbi:MAG: hypothetical protein IJP82_00110, partial [Bacteroidaceae bacterium]|nr:hypothetical protein [Bacteroidaceae bacterium]
PSSSHLRTSIPSFPRTFLLRLRTPFPPHPLTLPIFPLHPSTPSPAYVETGVCRTHPLSVLGIIVYLSPL